MQLFFLCMKTLFYIGCYVIILITGDKGSVIRLTQVLKSKYAWSV